MNKTKRINLLITVFDLHFGGISNLILQTAPALMKNIDVEVIYFGAKDEMLPRFRKADIPTSRIPYRGLKDIWSVGRKLGEYINKEGIGIVSTHLAIDKAIVSIAKLYASFKIISTLHSVNNPYISKNLNYLATSKFEDYFHNVVVDRNFAVSKASLESWKKYRNLNCGKTTIIYSGIERLKCNKQSGRNYEAGDKIFVTACRITYEKGLDRLLRLFAALPEKNWELWIIGEGPLKSGLENMVKDFGLEKKIYFKGFQTDLCQFYELADFYINSSYQEALPVSILEAMSIGLPILGSNVGGVPETVIEGRNGYLIDFEEKESGEEIIRRCLNFDKEQYEMLSRNAFKIFNDKFSIEHYVEKFKFELNQLY